MISPTDATLSMAQVRWELFTWLGDQKLPIDDVRKWFSHTFPSLTNDLDTGFLGHVIENLAQHGWINWKATGPIIETVWRKESRSHSSPRRPLDSNDDNITIMSVSQFIERITALPSEVTWMFRGQSNGTHPLVPKAGRKDFQSPRNRSLIDRLGETQQGGFHAGSDTRAFDEWCREAIAVYPNLPESTLERLALAQHYGLATRLLDWATNPLVALYFACEDNDDSQRDGAVFCVTNIVPIYDVGVGFIHSDSPVQCYNPKPFDRRMLNQTGRFTIHRYPSAPLEYFDIAPVSGDRGTPIHPPLSRMVIPFDRKSRIQLDLHALGVDRRSLFPDAEGLSSTRNWLTRLESMRS